MIDLDGGGLLKPFNVECKKINNLKKKGGFLKIILLKKFFKEKSQKEIIEYFTILNNDAPKSGIQVRGKRFFILQIFKIKKFFNQVFLSLVLFVIFSIMA